MCYTYYRAMVSTENGLDVLLIYYTGLPRCSISLSGYACCYSIMWKQSQHLGIFRNGMFYEKQVI